MIPIRLAPLAALALSLAACSGNDAPRNVVFITVDTLRADRTTPYGHARDTTPTLARLAANGTLFERAYAMSSWTLPSMSMLVTGEIKPLADQAILPTHEAIAETFDAAGYRTCAILANPLLSADYGYDRGVDRYELTPSAHAERWDAREVVDRGLAWLEESDADGEPFFLWLHPFDPHAPYAPVDGQAFDAPIEGDASRANAVRSLESQYAAGDDRADPDRLNDKAWARIEKQRDLYDSDVLQFDREIGRLLDVLEERGDLENTLIVVTSDHGEGLWQRATNPDERMPNPMFPGLYDGHGTQLYEEQVRVPLVFSGPGVPRGTRVAEPVDLVDVTPSILALADVPVGRTYGGTPLFDGGRVELAEQSEIIAVCSRARTITVDGRWRLHEPKEFRLKKDGVHVRLYDLENDPLELSPIDDPDRIADYRARLEAWHDKHAPEGLEPAPMSAERIRLLQSLGYGGEAEHMKQLIERFEKEEDDG